MRLGEFDKGGIFMHNGSKSSLVANVKAKKDMDPLLVELKKLVIDKKI